MKTFTERFNEALEIKHTTCAEISKRTGIYESTLSNYRKGKYAPKQDKLEIIAKALDVSIPWLMGADVPMDEFDIPSPVEQVQDELFEKRKLLFDLSSKATEEDLDKFIKMLNVMLGEDE